MKFDTEKTKAIEHTGSPLLVTAGPGSGKTRVTTQNKMNNVWENCIFSDEIVSGD